MPRKISTLVLTVVALVSLNVVCFAQTLMTRHTREEVTSHIAPLVGHLPANQKMELTLVLQNRNQPELEQFVKEVSDPSSPLYRHYLNVEQFTEKYGPSREDYDSVKAWARQNGLRVLAGSRNRMIVRVSGTVDGVEKALHVTLGQYQHPTENRTFFAPDREPTPYMSVRLWSIGGLDNFSRPTPMFSKRDLNSVNEDTVIGNATIGSGPGNSFLGSDMRAAYYSAAGGTLTGTGQSVGLFEFIGTDLADLTTYYANVGQTNNVPVTLVSVDGQSVNCTDNSQGGFCDDTEQTLDMTQALGMAPGLSSLVMYIGKGGLSGQTLDDAGILNGMATASPLNNALSCSWAWRPPDPTTDDPFFLQFQAQGQSFFTASGDSGNWAFATFVWPADDPNLITVGGTDLTTSSAGGPWSSETGWADTGGGISPNKFAIPSWQVAAAAGCAKCSQSFRNGPDVSANANFSFYVCADQTRCSENNFGGTSFATPMWAGLIALANEQAANNGQGPVGFINPTLYQTIYANSTKYAADFHDVTSGGNSLGSAVGYDLSTGIGSPQGQNLINDLVTVTADFGLSAKPQIIRVSPGSTGHTAIISSVTGGFSGAIALTSSGGGPGVQVRFSPSSITGAGQATMMIRVSSTAKKATRTITVTGTSGALTHTTTVTLSIP